MNEVGLCNDIWKEYQKDSEVVNEVSRSPVDRRNRKNGILLTRCDTWAKQAAILLNSNCIDSKDILDKIGNEISSSQKEYGKILEILGIRCESTTNGHKALKLFSEVLF